MNITIDKNGNIVITSPDFPIGDKGDGDEIIKDSLDKLGVTEEGLIDSEIINNIEYKDGETHYYDSSDKILTEEEYNNINCDLVDNSNPINETIKEKVIMVSSTTGAGMASNQIEVGSKIENPGYIVLEPGPVIDEIIEVFSKDISLTEVKDILDGADVSEEVRYALEKYFDETFVDESMKTGQFMIGFILALKDAKNIESLKGISISRLEYASLASAFLSPLFEALDLDSSVLGHEDLNRLSKYSKFALFLAAILTIGTDGVAPLVISILSALAGLVDLVIKDDIKSTVDYGINVGEDGIGNIHFFFTSENSSGKKVAFDKNVNLDLNNTPQTLNQIITFADMSRTNILLELNRLLLKRNKNLKKAQNTLHEEIKDELSAYDFYSETNTKIYNKTHTETHNEIPANDTAGVFAEIKEIYGIKNLYNNNYYSWNPIPSNTTELKSGESIIYNHWLHPETASISSIPVIVSTFSQIGYNSNYDSINLCGSAYFETDTFLGTSRSLDIDYVNLLGNNLSAYYYDKIENNRSTMEETMEAKANEADVKIEGSWFLSNVSFDSFMSSTNDGMRNEGAIDSSISSLNSLFETLSLAIEDIIEGIGTMDETDKEIAERISKWHLQ